jgi:hypothetical protein
MVSPGSTWRSLHASDRRKSFRVTAKLSRKFYETFGDELTNELVERLNQVDATYRSDLRELNELNFARFEAKLDKQLAELRVEFRTEVGALRTELHTGLARLEGGLLARIGLAEVRLARRTASLWIATLVALTALIKL